MTNKTTGVTKKVRFTRTQIRNYADVLFDIDFDIDLSDITYPEMITFQEAMDSPVSLKRAIKLFVKVCSKHGYRLQQKQLNCFKQITHAYNSDIQEVLIRYRLLLGDAYNEDKIT